MGRVDPDGSSAFKVLMGYQKDFHEWDPPGSSRGLKTRIIKESRQLSVKLRLSSTVIGYMERPLPWLLVVSKIAIGSFGIGQLEDLLLVAHT